MDIPIILKELTKVGVVALTEKSVETFVGTKIKPIFENWGKEDSRSIELEECLSEYLLRCYGKNNIMTTIVFGRLQKTLEDLYIPLTLEEYKNDDAKWLVNENCYDILDKFFRILIIDMAGMGKSTIVKYFACQGINLDKSIPIVIELRKLEKNQSILEYIQLQINSLDKNIEIEEIVDILKKGDFVIFFDGYDEIANENKPDVLDAIQDFTSKANNTKIIITSRDEEDLNSLGDFKCVNIKPLSKNEAYSLIEKYDNNGDISKKLITRLKEDSSMDILSEFLKNPLLVSLLYKTFEYKEEIPYKKIDFYEQVYAALFNDHDKTKGSAYVHEKKTKLDKFQFEQILRTFGFLSLKQDKVGYSDQLIHNLLEQSIKRFSWLDISSDDFLYDITHAVPFIQKDGNEYKWVHKSFMEYFASCFICYDNKEFEEKYLEGMIGCNKPMKYFNVLDFCYEMDVLNFRKYLILPFLEEFISKFEQSFKDSYFEVMKKEDIYYAKQMLSIAEEIEIVSFGYNPTKTEKSEYSTLIGEYVDEDRAIHIQNNTKTNILSYKIHKAPLYKIMKVRMPELFIRLKNNKIRKLDIKFTTKMIFNDKIDNPININEEVFSAVVNYCSYSLDRTSCKFLDIIECKRIKNEIQTEINFRSDNIFDL